MNIRYPALLETQEDGGYTVTFPDLEEAVTEGDTVEEALFNASEVLTLTLDGRLEEDIPIPQPSEVEEAYRIAPDAKTQAALLVRFARADRSLSELARQLNTSWPAAQRLEDAKHWPSLRQLERAATALGKRLVLSFEP